MRSFEGRESVAFEKLLHATWHHSLDGTLDGNLDGTPAGSNSENHWALRVRLTREIQSAHGDGAQLDTR